MWNKPTAKSIGEPTLKETNPANNNSYDVKFVIVPNELDCLLCLKTVQQLKLVTINADHFIHNVKEDFGDLGEVKLMSNGRCPSNRFTSQKYSSCYTIRGERTN